MKLIIAILALSAYGMGQTTIITSKLKSWRDQCNGPAGTVCELYDPKSPAANKLGNPVLHENGIYTCEPAGAFCLTPTPKPAKKIWLENRKDAKCFGACKPVAHQPKAKTHHDFVTGEHIEYDYLDTHAIDVHICFQFDWNNSAAQAVVEVPCSSEAKPGQFEFTPSADPINKPFKVMEGISTIENSGISFYPSVNKLEIGKEFSGEITFQDTVGNLWPVCTKPTDNNCILLKFPDGSVLYRKETK